MDVGGGSVIMGYVLGGITLLFIMQGVGEMGVGKGKGRRLGDVVEEVLGN